MNRRGIVVMDQALDLDSMTRRHRLGRGTTTAMLPPLPLSRERAIDIAPPDEPQERSCARERPTHKYVLDRELEKRNRELERRNIATNVPPPALGFVARAFGAIKRAPRQVVGFLQQGFAEFAIATKDAAEFNGGILPQDILSNGFIMIPNYRDYSPWPEEEDSADSYVTAKTSFENRQSSRSKTSTYANPPQPPPPAPPSSVLPVDLLASNKPLVIPKIFVNDAELPGSVSPFELPSPVTPKLPAPTSKKLSPDDFLALLRKKPESVLNAPVFWDDEDEEDRPSSQPPIRIPVKDECDTATPEECTSDKTFLTTPKRRRREVFHRPDLADGNNNNKNNNGRNVKPSNSEWQYAPYQTPPQPRLPAHIKNSSPQTFFELLEKNPDAVRNASVFSSSDNDEDQSSSRGTTNPVPTPVSTTTNSVAAPSVRRRTLPSLLSDEDRSLSRSTNDFVAPSFIPRRILDSLLSDEERSSSRSTSTAPLPTSASTTTNNSVAARIPSIIKSNGSTVNDTFVSFDEWEDISNPSTNPRANPILHGPGRFRCSRCKWFVCVCGKTTIRTNRKKGEVRPGPRRGSGGGNPTRHPPHGRGGAPGWGLRGYRTRFERTHAANEMPGYDPFEGISTSPITFERRVLVHGVWEKPKKKLVESGVGEGAEKKQQLQEEEEKKREKKGEKEQVKNEQKEKKGEEDKEAAVRRLSDEWQLHRT